MNKSINKANEGTLKRYEDLIKKSSSKGQRISAIRRFIEHLNSIEKSVTEVNHSHVEVFLEEEFEEREETKQKKKKTTINNYYSFLKAYFKYLKTTHENTDIDFDKVSIERIKNTIFRIYTDEQVQEFFSLVDRIENTEIKLRDSIFLQILFYTGCGLKEARDIFVYQVESDLSSVEYENYIVLDKKILHFNDSEREFILYDNLVSDIRKYQQMRASKENEGKVRAKDYLFWSYYKGKYNHISVGSLQRDITKIKECSSFKDEKLSIINIKYTVIKNLLKSYSVDEVSAIVGLDISKIQMFVNTRAGITQDSNFYSQHPFMKFLIPPTSETLI